MMEDERYETWMRLMAEIERARTAAILLQRIYLEIGPYNDRKVDPETWNTVRDFFGFDDSA